MKMTWVNIADVYFGRVEVDCGGAEEVLGVCAMYTECNRNQQRVTRSSYKMIYILEMYKVHGKQKV